MYLGTRSITPYELKHKDENKMEVIDEIKKNL